MASVKQTLVKSSTTRNKTDYIRIKTRDNIENRQLLFPCNIKIFSVKKKRPKFECVTGEADIPYPIKYCIY